MSTSSPRPSSPLTRGTTNRIDSLAGSKQNAKKLLNTGVRPFVARYGALSLFNYAVVCTFSTVYLDFAYVHYYYSN